MNLFKDFADLARRDMATRGYDVADVEGDDHAAVMMYLKIKRYAVQPRPRVILKAAGFQCPPQHLQGLNQLELAIRRGEDLTPYRSKNVASAGSRDGLLDYWGIHHFHLGAALMNDGFVERTEQLLFCLIHEEYACFLKVAAHNPSPWAEKDLIEVIHQNWPEVIGPYRIPNISSLSPEISDEDRKELRAANVTTFLDMQDGTIYCEPGFGNTSGGLHLTDLGRADHIRRVANAVEDRIKKNWVQIAADAKSQGYNLRDTEALTMRETIPNQYWDIMDRRTGYWFRQYLEA